MLTMIVLKICFQCIYFALNEKKYFFILQGETYMYYLSKIALWLVIIGGLNWGLVGAFDFNLVSLIFGNMSILARIVYILVGLSAIWLIYEQFVPDTVVIEKR